MLFLLIFKNNFIDVNNHEKISANILKEDKNLKNFFTEEEIKIMAEAVFDHRASMKGNPKSIYGKNRLSGLC